MTTPVSPTTPNYSIQALIPIYMLSWLPHGYFLLKGMSTGAGFSVMTPRTNLEALKPKLDAETWSKLARARGAHLNALEGYPLFAAAMIAGNMAKLPAHELNTLTAEYVGVRMLYNLMYMNSRNEMLSYMRSGVYYWSVGIPMYALWKAGNALM